jgi:hypothetical protein
MYVQNVIWDLGVINIVKCWLVTRQKFVDSGFFASIYWINRQGELHLLITVSILL